MSHPGGTSYWRVRSVERWQLLLAYLILVVAMAISLYWTHDLASQADQKAAKAQTVLHQQQFAQSLRNEQVCSLSNQGDACRDLFDRLAKSITPTQRYRLGCQALGGLLPNKQVTKIRKVSHCPAPSTTGQ